MIILWCLQLFYMMFAGVLFLHEAKGMFYMVIIGYSFNMITCKMV